MSEDHFFDAFGWALRDTCLLGRSMSELLLDADPSVSASQADLDRSDASRHLRPSLWEPVSLTCFERSAQCSKLTAPERASRFGGQETQRARADVFCAEGSRTVFAPRFWAVDQTVSKRQRLPVILRNIRRSRMARVVFLLFSVMI